MNISLQNFFGDTFLKILNFEQACHFGSKQVIQKQWSLTGIIDASFKKEYSRYYIIFLVSAPRPKKKMQQIILEEGHR